MIQLNTTGGNKVRGFSGFRGKSLLILPNSYPDKDNKHYGGIFVKEQVNELAKYFNKIYVISPQPFGSNRALVDYEYRNVRVFFPRFFHVPVGYFRRKLGENFFKAALRVIQQEKLEFDIIHAHFTWPSGYAGMLLKRKFKVPLVITAHGYDVYDLPFRNSTMFKKVKLALDSADHIVTVSRKNFGVLIKKLGVPEEKISVIPNGFDSKLFRPMSKMSAKRQLDLPEDKRILLNVANLVPVKGHRYLIQAMKKVVDRNKDVALFIVGDGPLRKDLEKLISDLNLKGYVHLVGARPHSEIPLWMNAADIFVLPSLSESFGVVQIEAMACGAPVVATINGGSEEIVISEDYGLLCPPADPECLAEKILIVLEKEWDREKIRKYAEQFTWGRIAKQILKVYHITEGR